MHYRHTQIGTVIISVIVIIIVFFLILGVTTESLRSSAIPMIVLLLVVMLLFASLTVEIKDGCIICSFGPGLIRKKIPLSEILRAESVHNPWFLGRGIRWMPGQYWLWNVSGYDAIELNLMNGSKFRIGTDEPELLRRAIEMNKQAAN